MGLVHFAQGGPMAQAPAQARPLRLDRQERNDLYSRTTQLTIEDTPEVAEERDNLVNGERASWGHEWDNEMNVIERKADRR